MKSRTPALLASLGANLIYSLNYLIAKGIMPNYLEPRAIIFLRVAGASAIFWIVSRLIRNDLVERVDLKRIAFASLFGVTINQILFFEGLNLSTPINASIIMLAVPLAVLAFSAILEAGRIPFVKIIGILIGTSGAVMLVLFKGSFDISSSTAMGNLLIIINASSYALYLVLIKPMMLKYHPITVMKWVFLFGMITSTPFTINAALTSQWNEIPLNIWISILYVVVFTTVLAYLLNNFSLKHISPATNSAFIYLQPVFTTSIAIALGLDSLHPYMFVPALLIFSGVFIVSFRQKT